MLLRLVIEAEAEDPQAAKEDLAMALERYAPARVVEVAPVYRQTEMAGACGHAPIREKVAPAARSACGGITPSVSAAPSHLPQEGGKGRVVVGPFARADAAFRAAAEANKEIRR